MKPASTRYTAEDFWRLPDVEGQIQEIIEGELVVTAAPNRNHQDVVLNVAVAFRRFLDGKHRAIVMLAPFAVTLSADTVVQPDILVILSERRSILHERGVEGAPDLVIEVLSPSTRSRDLGAKRRAYAKAGVVECWFFDVDDRRIEVCVREGKELVTKGVITEGVLRSLAVLPDFEMTHEAVFAEQS